MRNYKHQIRHVAATKSEIRNPKSEIEWIGYLGFVFCLLFGISILGFPGWCKGVEGGLRFRFQPGDKFSFVSVTEKKIVRYVDSREEVLEQTLRLECDFDVEEVEADGCAWAKYTYGRVAFNAKGGGVDMEYDSQAPRPKVTPQVLPLHFARGESFFIRVTPQGHIDKINGLSAVMGNAKSKIPNVAERDRFIQLVEQYFDEAAIKRELESRLAVFPDSAPANSISDFGFRISDFVDIGSSWSRRELIDDDPGAPGLLNWTWRLSQRRGIAPDIIAVIDVNLVALPASPDASRSGPETPDEQEVTIGGVRARREVKGQGSGRIEVDEATGRIINSTITQDLVETIRLLPEGPIRRPPPAPAPTRTHIVTTFQMIKRLPAEAGR